MPTIFDPATDYPCPGAERKLQRGDSFSGTWSRKKLVAFFRALARQHPAEMRVAGPDMFLTMLRVDPEGVDIWVMLTFFPRGHGTLFVDIFINPHTPLDPNKQAEFSPDSSPEMAAAQALLSAIGKAGEEIPLVEAAGLRLSLRAVYDPDYKCPWGAQVVFRDATTGEDLDERLKPKRKPRPKRPGRRLETVSSLKMASDRRNSRPRNWSKHEHHQTV